uniref:NADH-ubiquinone oxidoreductase chain 2 n=1 Tax=Latridiidae sp. 1 KM-2017 TaxID=2219441 RepID=A0A346RFR5_9CUCU|nr:NADH dehydrogenase subunit 2 [Latridiidae sp. 1 KM-2017]
MFLIYKFMFITFLVMGTLISISAFNWMSMWIGLEINLMSIIPLISNQNNMYASEASLKYFITQTLASIVLLFSIIMINYMLEFIPQNFNEMLIMIMNSTFLTKMGAAPFHFWFPEIIEGLNWINSFIMLTWQKIAPMILLMYNMTSMIYLSIIIIISMIIGGIMGLNQTSMRKILTFSSINHIAWMLASMMMNQSIWLIYFVIYAMISLNLILILNKFNIFYINQMNSIFNSNKQVKMLFILNFLSLGGLPPMLGFLPKWITVNYLIETKMITLSLLMIILTLITLFFYMRLTFNSFLINSTENMIPTPFISNTWIFTLNSIFLMSLIFSTMIFNFF